MKYLLAPFRFAISVWRSICYIIAGRPVIAPRHEYERREAICAYCRHNQDGVCGLCACFIGAKILLSSEQCPDKPPRWLRLT